MRRLAPPGFLATIARAAMPVLWLGASAGAWADDGAAEGVLGHTVWDTMQRGGSVMYIILAMSVVGLAVILEAAVRIRRSGIMPTRLVQALGPPNARPDIDRVLEVCPKSSLNRVLRAGYLWRKGDTDQIQGAIEDAVDDMLWKFRRSVRPLGVLATTTPLLGLLGTVIGIIQAFDAVAGKGALGDPGALAGGISKALLTTCFGLIVAIPMVLAHHYFSGKAEALLRACEELVKEHLILPPE